MAEKAADGGVPPNAEAVEVEITYLTGAPPWVAITLSPNWLKNHAPVVATTYSSDHTPELCERSFAAVAPSMIAVPLCSPAHPPFHVAPSEAVAALSPLNGR